MPQDRSVRERLTVPLWWWLVAIVLAFTLVVAVGAYTNEWFALATALLCLAGIGWGFTRYGSAVVGADEDGFTAGSSHIEWPWVTSVEALDAHRMRTLLGPAAKATAFQVTRPYVPTGVKVVLDDPADPHPYWVVSTRHPERVAAVAGAHLAAQAQPSGSTRRPDATVVPGNGATL